MEEWKKYIMSDFIDFNPTISLKKGTVARKITMDKLIPHSRDIYEWEYEPFLEDPSSKTGILLWLVLLLVLKMGSMLLFLS